MWTADENIIYYAGKVRELAKKLNPIIRGLINYFHKFWQAGMRPVWNGLNHRLLCTAYIAQALRVTHH